MIRLLLCRTQQTQGKTIIIRLEKTRTVPGEYIINSTTSVNLKLFRLDEASFSPIPDENNDETSSDEPISGDQFSQLRFQIKIPFQKSTFFILQILEIVLGVSQSF